ncbi:hypothetical protein PVAP13_7KG024774 [Panicum virgatum]|uniref:Uncharacterized protein n=1 Tax=Panicum virgatum TaxID=38727 RepID=A0A8T0QCR0_PANVG|nr:hypothetical protein PVAP13_7KG024774 [Panicum virgatum]
MSSSQQTEGIQSNPSRSSGLGKGEDPIRPNIRSPPPSLLTFLESLACATFEIQSMLRPSSSLPRPRSGSSGSASRVHTDLPASLALAKWGADSVLSAASLARIWRSDASAVTYAGFLHLSCNATEPDASLYSISHSMTQMNACQGRLPQLHVVNIA